MLSEAGFDIRGVVRAGTRDEDALQAVSRSGERRLVLPFHAHRDDHGSVADGLTLARRVVEIVPGARILMPVSSFGAAAVSIATTAGTLPRCVLLLPEEDLGSPGLAERVREHLEKR